MGVETKVTKKILDKLENCIAGIIYQNEAKKKIKTNSSIVGLPRRFALIAAPVTVKPMTS